MSRLLAPVPDRPPRAAIYLRQSVSHDDSISLELQRTACEDHCARLGYTVSVVESDPGISGRTWKRPAVVRVMSLVDERQIDVVVLWKWSRLSRNRRDWAVAVDRIESAGGRLESATEPVDTATSTGRLARGMLAEFAAFESERIGDTWREAHARRVNMGLPANGKPRWGYLYSEGRFTPDPKTGPVLAALYRRYLGGESMYSLMQWLNSEGYLTAAGYTTSGPGVWSDRSLRRMLDSGFGAGLLTVKGQHRPGAHEAVISPEEWRAYLGARAVRRTTAPRERSQYLLSGLVRCVCGSSMTGGQFGHARVAKYRCKQAREQARHSGGYITMTFVEDAVIQWLREVAEDLDSGTKTALSKESSLKRVRRDAATLAREVTKLDAQLTVLTRQVVSGLIPESAYASVRDEIQIERAGLITRLHEAEARSIVVGSPAVAARQLLANWHRLDVPLRRANLKSLINVVIVTTGRPRGTVQVVPFWRG